MQIKFLTDVGKKRKNNQDAVGVFANQHQIPFAVVADGMGGHQAGDVASAMTIRDLGKAWEKNTLDSREEIVQWLLKIIQLENEKIFNKGEEEEKLAGMGTTIVAAVFIEETLLLAHVGDSRCYLLRNSVLKQITEDHSLVNELVKTGEITQDMAVHHPRKNVLVRSLGLPTIVEIDVLELELLVHDQILLCTDGLTNMLDDQRIQTIMLEKKDVEKRLEQLIDEANEAGGKDNITVLLAENVIQAEEETHG